MKSFDEYWNNYEESSDFVNSRYSCAQDAFEAGQQSKQAEVNELQKRVDEAMWLLNTRHHNADVSNIILRMHKILKGDQS